MEPISLTATLVAALLAGAATGAGEATITELSQHVRQRFRKEGKEGLLERSQENPEAIKAELISQMKDDQEYQNRLEKSLEAIGLTRQVVLSDIGTEGGIKVEDISLEDYGSYLLEQVVLSHLNTAKDIEVKGLHIKSQKKTSIQ
ncbi:MAG TPA: hypothetical protein V6D26_30800 [Stenomitos sp.]